MTEIEREYAALVAEMRQLGAALIPAHAARYEAPPQSGATREKNERGVRNPTLEIVLDPRRTAVSEAIDTATSALRQARHILTPHTPALMSAVARWEGSPEGSQ